MSPPLILLIGQLIDNLAEKCLPAFSLSMRGNCWSPLLLKRWLQIVRCCSWSRKSKDLRKRKSLNGRAAGARWGERGGMLFNLRQECQFDGRFQLDEWTNTLQTDLAIVHQECDNQQSGKARPAWRNTTPRVEERKSWKRRWPICNVFSWWAQYFKWFRLILIENIVWQMFVAGSLISASLFDASTKLMFQSSSVATSAPSSSMKRRPPLTVLSICAISVWLKQLLFLWTLCTTWGGKSMGNPSCMWNTLVRDNMEVARCVVYENGQEVKGMPYDAWSLWYPSLVDTGLRAITCWPNKTSLANKTPRKDGRISCCRDFVAAVKYHRC